MLSKEIESTCDYLTRELCDIGVQYYGTYKKAKGFYDIKIGANSTNTAMPFFINKNPELSI